VLRHLVEVLRSVIELLARFGETARADWLAARLATLRDPASMPEHVGTTIDELHEVVLGMGGLMDLHLRGRSQSETEEANEDLERLADQLFELTR
jgi:hypothetical protein